MQLGNPRTCLKFSRRTRVEAHLAQFVVVVGKKALVTRFSSGRYDEEVDPVIDCSSTLYFSNDFRSRHWCS